MDLIIDDTNSFIKVKFVLNPCLSIDWIRRSIYSKF